MAEDEVEGAQPGELVALDRPAAQVAEVAADALGVERAAQEREGVRRAGRDADVGVVALVTRACVGDAPEPHARAGSAALRQVDRLGRRRERTPRAAHAGRRRRELADDTRLPAHDLDAWDDELPRHERRPVGVRLLYLRPAAEDTEPSADIHGDEAYRREMAAVFTRRALAVAAARAGASAEEAP